MPLLQRKQKWNSVRKNLEPGDVVLMMDETLPRGQWPLGKVAEVTKDQKGLVRQVVVRRGTSTFRRPVSKLVKLVSGED